MKNWAISSLVLAAVVNAHTIFQQVSVNGAAKGLLVGVRSPDSNYPNYDVTSNNIICNSGFHNPVSTTVIDIPAGAKVGAQWGHVIGGAQYSPDPDNPIAASHKGPVSFYLAKVDNAGTAGYTGLTWFKVSEDGLNGGKWGVDNMIANGGWSYFTMPTCVPSGNYLLRAEIIALHNAYSSGGAQLYMACANINVTGGGVGTLSGSTTSIPGAYPQNDPGILINIYGASGQPDNGGKSYAIPGPRPITCSGSGTAQQQTSTTSSRTTTTVTTGTRQSTSSPYTMPTTSIRTTTTTGGTGAPLYGQCGGTGWTGATTCASGTCKVSNQYYSQCLP